MEPLGQNTPSGARVPPLLAVLAIAWLVGVACGPRLADVLTAGSEGSPLSVASAAIARAPGTAGAVVQAALAIAALYLAGRVASPAWRAARAASRASARRWMAAALFLVAGLARERIANRPLDAAHVARANGSGAVTLWGCIASEPDVRDTAVGYRVAVHALARGSRPEPSHGLVLVWAAPEPRHGYGDTVEVSGEMEEPPMLDNFDYRAYLARQGIHSIMWRASVTRRASGGGNPIRRRLFLAKDRSRRALSSSMPAPESALAKGILLGDDSAIPARTADAFRSTNTTHVIAISGSNISLLVAGLALVLGRALGPRRCVPAVLVAVGLYTALVGAEPAVVRAAVMGGLMVAAGVFGRRGDALVGLFVAAWLMTLYRPGYLEDLGFQLSFAATLGLIVLVPVLSRRSGPDIDEPHRSAPRAAEWFREAVVVTVAAQLATWPLLANQLGQVSAAGLVANFLIVPVQPAVMVLGALTIAAGLAVAPLAPLVGALAWAPTAFTIRVVEWAAGLPLASVSWRMPTWALVAYYAALTAVVAVRGPSPGSAVSRVAGAVRALPAAVARGVGAPSGPRARRAAVDRLAGPALALAAACCAIVWISALRQPDGLLHIHMLDVGQGDSVLVVTPNGRRMLVDGGPAPSAVLDRLGRLFAPWDRRLDVVVLTHPDLDHVAGLAAVLERYDVGAIVDAAADAVADSEAAGATPWRDAVAREGAHGLRAGAGMTIVLDETAGVFATVLWPPASGATAGDSGASHAGLVASAGAVSDVNAASTVLRLTYGRTAALFTGDLDDLGEAALLSSRADLRADVLKVSHHGSASSTTADFLRAVRPGVALIGVGADNRYGHPAPELLDRLAGIPVVRTDRSGNAEILSDGRSLWLRGRSD